MQFSNTLIEKSPFAIQVVARVECKELQKLVKKSGPSWNRCGRRRREKDMGKIVNDVVCMTQPVATQFQQYYKASHGNTFQYLQISFLYYHIWDVKIVQAIEIFVVLVVYILGDSPHHVLCGDISCQHYIA